MQYSEIFYAHQGEIPCGVPSVWVRFSLCNLQCRGFGRNASNMIAPVNAFLKDIPVRVEDLKGDDFNFGCDSAYSWDARFKKIWKDEEPMIVAQKILDLLPNRTFEQPYRQPIALTFTGGEPLLKANQEDIVALILALEELGEFPSYVYFETNGTQDLTAELVELLRDRGIKTTFNVSPKLESVTWEKAKKAIRPEAVLSYTYQNLFELNFKFVVNGTEESWNEMEDALVEFMRYSDILDATIGIYAMPSGATNEQQKALEVKVAEEALRRGYGFAPRIQCTMFENAIGK